MSRNARSTASTRAAARCTSTPTSASTAARASRSARSRRSTTRTTCRSKWAVHIADNARFFTDILPGLDLPLGSPGGAAKLGALPADTPLVAGLRRTRWKARTMRERRQQVLDTIQRAAEPVGVSEIADRLGVHPNTVRFHLEALVDDGIIERVPDTPSGPGRPRVGYRARPGLARGGARRYRELAEILLGHLSATSDDPAAAATAVGRTWGAHLVPRPAPSPRRHPRRRGQAADRDARRPGLRT